MRKLLRVLLTALQLAILAGAFTLYHFYNSSMGVRRHLLYLSHKWALPFSVELGIVIIAIAGILLLQLPKGFRHLPGVHFRERR